MSYKKTDWKNYPSQDTPIKAAAFNNLENGIAYCDEFADEIIKGNKNNFTEVELGGPRTSSSIAFFKEEYGKRYGISVNYPDNTPSSSYLMKKADVLVDLTDSDPSQNIYIYDEDIHYMSYPFIAVESIYSTDETEIVSYTLIKTKYIHQVDNNEYIISNTKAINPSESSLYAHHDITTRYFWGIVNNQKKYLQVQNWARHFYYSDEKNKYIYQTSNTFCRITKIYGVEDFLPIGDY